MAKVNKIFEHIEKLTQKEGQSEFIAAIITDLLQKEEHVPLPNEANSYQLLKTFILKIIQSIDELSKEISKDSSILISVKHQKLLRKCFQLISSLGISPCLIPGIGVSLDKRCSTSSILPRLKFTIEEKYELLTICTDFFTRSYKVSILKSMILHLHLSDYLAALIQLAFAPLKKPGVYKDYTMTEDRYNQLRKDRLQYVQIYKELGENCFQPILMKELLVLQGMTNPPAPNFVKRLIVKEMSQRLLAEEGLLNLIRCFIESYDIDTGFEWKKIDMICKIVSVKHGEISQDEYLANICSQLEKILSMNNSHYLVSAVACLMRLHEKYSDSILVQELVKKTFEVFHLDSLKSNGLPGTVILSPKEVDHSVNILHECVCTTNLNWPLKVVSPNIEVLFLIGTKCTKNDDFQIRLQDILIKSFEKLDQTGLKCFMKSLLNGHDCSGLTIEEYDAGIAIKSSVSSNEKEDIQSDKIVFFLKLIDMSTSIVFVALVFEVLLEILLQLKKKRREVNRDLLSLEEEPDLIDDLDAQYANTLQLLSEISTSPKLVLGLKDNPISMLIFVEKLLERDDDSNVECTSIALIILNIFLSNIENIHNNINVQQRCTKMKPVLEKLASNKEDLNHILSREVLSLISGDVVREKETACSKAINDVFDDLLPVTAHGLIELTRLIEVKDPETISKKLYIFCIFKEQLKNKDSYVYLAAINGLAALGTHCTEDVLQVLCSEFLQISSNKDSGKDADNERAELRMKIGDIIVIITRKLGEMAVVYKTLLLNTMLCACRDDDPLIRTSALSNLAEIARVLHYKIGNIIYEVLLCIWSIIETDKAIECRRAAVMVISSLLKGLGKETLVQLKENLLPIYRTLKILYNNNNEDSILRLHAQIGLEELNDIVKQFLLPEVKIEKHIQIENI